MARRASDHAVLEPRLLIRQAAAERCSLSNPCERGGRIYEVDRTDIIWKETDLSKLFAVASKDVREVVLVALWTGQRQGDVLALNAFSYDGKTIRLKQSKSGRHVSIPAAEVLRVILDPSRERGCDSSFVCRRQMDERWFSRQLQ
ncbi:hypothetical protein QBC99_000068 [Beijerinckia sp. GAS462]|nr:hypothetical protein [Beijerinckia sp. GAS462]